MDPNFTSGAFTESKDNLAKIFVALGGNPDRLKVLIQEKLLKL